MISKAKITRQIVRLMRKYGLSHSQAQLIADLHYGGSDSAP